jgi:ketosteroid isomerase-like protein
MRRCDFIATLGSVVAVWPLAARAQQPGCGHMPENDDIAAAAAGFYSALNALFEGDLAPMIEVWSHADDVTYMGPDGGFQVGWKEILGEWEKQAAMKLDGHVEPDAMRITCGRDLAVTHNYEKGKNINTRGVPGSVLIRATNLFRKENGIWKMIGHHTDNLPFLSQEDAP